MLGNECLRALQFSYCQIPPEPGREIDGRKKRIFDRGHMMEDYVARCLLRAGFNLQLKSSTGKQFEISLLGGRVKGHCDGVFVGGPAVIKYPALWENKCLGAKYYKQVTQQGLNEYSAVYYGQVQLMMAYFELTENPAVFTVLNADTMEIYTKFIAFDGATAQRVSDNAVTIIRACDAGELLPRGYSDVSFYKCRMCDWSERCQRHA